MEIRVFSPTRRSVKLRPRERFIYGYMATSPGSPLRSSCFLLVYLTLCYSDIRPLLGCSADGLLATIHTIHSWILYHFYKWKSMIHLLSLKRYSTPTQPIWADMLIWYLFRYETILQSAKSCIAPISWQHHIHSKKKYCCSISWLGNNLK